MNRNFSHPDTPWQKTTAEKHHYGADTRGVIYTEVPSLWYQCDDALPHEGVAVNGLLPPPEDKPAPGRTSPPAYLGYGEMVATPQTVTFAAYLYGENGKSRRHKVDEFTYERKKT